MEKKKFELEKDGKLRVVINNKSDLMLPVEGKNTKIGEFTQVTEQRIDKEHIPSLKAYVKGQRDMAKKQMDQLDEGLKKLIAVDENAIPDKVMQECAKAIGKGSKAFRKEMKVLNDNLARMQQKKQFLQQKEFIGKQLEQMEADLANIEKPVVL